MKTDGQRRFSLLNNGILDQPFTRLLLVNVGVSIFSQCQSCGNANNERKGMNDEVFPVEDSIIPLQQGDVKGAR